MTWPTAYIGRHGSARVARAVLVGAIPPLMLKTDVNPSGTPIEAFDAIRAGVSGDRSEFYKVCPGATHGLFATHKDRFNADLLAFISP